MAEVDNKAAADARTQAAAGDGNSIPAEEEAEEDPCQQMGLVD